MEENKKRSIDDILNSIQQSVIERSNVQEEDNNSYEDDLNEALKFINTDLTKDEEIKFPKISLDDLDEKPLVDKKANDIEITESPELDDNKKFESAPIAIDDMNLSENKISIPEKNYDDTYKIFETANTSLKDITDLFKSNIEIRKKIEEELKDLEEAKKEFNRKIKSEYDRFEQYKKDEENRIKEKEKQLNDAKDDLNNHIDSLRKEKEHYLQEKDELANNLDKFNNLVSEFYGDLSKLEK